MQLCVLCGVNSANPDKPEHIPPRGIFTKPIPNNENLITVPSCDTCNHGTSKDDQEFKACLSLAVGYSTPEQKNFWKGAEKGTARKTLQKNKKLQKQIVDSLKEYEVHTSAGFYVGNTATFSWSVDNHNKVIEKITRGLFFHDTQKILAADAKIEIQAFPQASGFPADILNRLNQCSDAKFINKCGSQFVCQYGIVADAENASLWLLQFYERHFVMVVTKSVDRD